MSADTNQPVARITPIDSEHALRVLNTWNLIWNWAVSQSLGFLYGISCCLLPMFAGLFFGWLIDASMMASAGAGMLMALTFSAAALIGLNFFGFPVLLFERRVCKRLLKAVDVRADPIISPYDPTTRVVELVPRERWRKRLCLDTATDLMIIRVDQRGVWMKGDRYRYELPAESILGASCEGFRPPCCSFQIHMVIVFVRTAEGTIELPLGYRDYSWKDLLGSFRREQAMNLMERINHVAKGHLYRPPQPPTVDDNHRYTPISRPNNPYAAPAMINE